LNAPSWKPTTPTASTIDYATLAATPSLDTSTATNRSFTNIRASDGKSLVKRFPLPRFDTLTPTSATAQGYFGLKWNTDHWDYVGPTGSVVQSSILRLDQVAAANREPNFFELLKAGILSGSVGLGSGNANTF